MKALCIRQPWAWAIIHAGKDIENRTWLTYYRGPVLIHAAKGMTRDEFEDFVDTYAHIRRLWSAEHPFGPERYPRLMPAFEALRRGGIVGKARIADCVSSSPSPWFFGPYGFVLADVEPLPFRPLKGALGFFDVLPDDVEECKTQVVHQGRLL